MQPLTGITVVTLEHAVAAPFATRQLADLGARVIKVERPGVGDFARGYDSRVRGLASHFVWINRSKETLTLDVKHAHAQQILQRLILEEADVLVQNLAPGAAALREELSGMIAQAFAGLSAAEVAQRLDAAGIANGQVNTMEQVWAHPQLAARQRWRTVDSTAGPIAALLPPGSWELGAPRMDAVPGLGQHTDAILAGLGYSAAQIAELHEQEAV